MKATHLSLSAQRLRQLLNYDSATGLFTRHKALARSWLHKVGTVDTCGYLIITVDDIQYKAHRLAWLYVTGEWPEETDHINGIRLDNRFCNLRSVSKSLNQQNLRRARKNNKTGFLGVSPNHKGFAASIRSNGEQLWLGTFKTPEEAHAVYLDAKRKLHQGCTI